MIKINLHNIEELILKNKELRSLMPELRHIFDKWLLSYRIPGFSSLRQESMVELLNSLKGHLDLLEQHFENSVSISEMDHKIVKNLEFSIDDVFGGLSENVLFDNFTISRNASKIYISTWR